MRTLRHLSLGATIALAVILWGNWHVLAAPGGGGDNGQAAQKAKKNVSSIAASDLVNDFGFRAFGQLAKQAGSNDNLLLSPVSLFIALDMVRAGAGGTTYDELSHALIGDGKNSSAKVAPDALHNLSSLVSGNTAPAELSVNSAIFAEGVKFQPAFVQECSKTFGAPVSSVSNEQEGIQKMTEWIQKATRGKITDARVNLAPDRFFILNAIYFKASWLDQFSAGGTTEEPFHLAGGRISKVQMMHKSFSMPVQHGSRDGVQMLRLPYGDSNGSIRGAQHEFAMYFFLPPKNQSPQAFLAALSNPKLNDYISTMHPREGQLSLPRFRIKSDLSLKPVLKQLGVKQAMTPGAADFSKMIENKVCWLDDVLQKGFLLVNEQGTEASVLTEALIAMGVSDPSSMFNLTFDRPFAFILRDDRTGAILFLGATNDPQAPEISKNAANAEFVKQAEMILVQAKAKENTSKNAGRSNYEYIEALNAAARSYLQAGKLREAASVYEELAAYEEARDNHYVATDCLSALASVYDRLGDQQKTVQTYRRLLRGYKTNATPKARGGGCVRNIGEWHEAVERYLDYCKKSHLDLTEAYAFKDEQLKFAIEDAYESPHQATGTPHWFNNDKLSAAEFTELLEKNIETMNGTRASLTQALKSSTTQAFKQPSRASGYLCSVLAAAQTDLGDFYVERGKNAEAVPVLQLAALNATALERVFSRASERADELMMYQQLPVQKQKSAEKAMQDMYIKTHAYEHAMPKLQSVLQRLGRSADSTTVARLSTAAEHAAEQLNVEVQRLVKVDRETNFRRR